MEQIYMFIFLCENIKYKTFELNYFLFYKDPFILSKIIDQFILLFYLLIQVLLFLYLRKQKVWFLI